MVARYDCSKRRSGSVGSFDASPSSEDDVRLLSESVSRDETETSSSSLERSRFRRRCAGVRVLVCADGIVVQC